MGKEGKINYKEFAEMDKFVQRIKHQVEKETEEKHHSIEHSGHQSTSSEVSALINKLFGRSSSTNDLTDYQATQQQQNDNRSLSSFGSGSVSPTSATSAEKLSVKFFTSPAKSPSCKRVSDHATISELVKDRVTFELLPALHKEMFCKEGRQRFLTWLFKLVGFHCYGFTYIQS